MLCLGDVEEVGIYGSFSGNTDFVRYVLWERYGIKR
jgi:hypothetical protein